MFDILLTAFIYLLILAFFVANVAIIVICATSKPPNLGCHESEKYFLDPNKDNVKVPFPSIGDPPSIDLTVIVPAYNEEERLPKDKMLDDAFEYLENRQGQEPTFSYEIILVDDGSKDQTTKVALTYSKKYGTDKMRVLTLAQNRGKGGAVRMGMFRGRGNRLLFADADGATRFSDIKSLENELEKINTKKHGMAVVCGSRAHLEKESIVERSVFRTILMFGFHFLVWFLCVQGVKDTQCGFKLFSRQAASLLFRNMHVERWAFDVDLLHLAQYYEIPVTEVAVNWQEIEGSKLSPLWASLQMGRDLFVIRLRYLLGAWKMEPKLKVQ